MVNLNNFDQLILAGKFKIINWIFSTKIGLWTHCVLGDEEPFWLQVTFISRHREDNIVVVVGPLSTLI